MRLLRLMRFPNLWAAISNKKEEKIIVHPDKLC